ncbi:hypothetical protein, partial [Maribacter sp. 2307ULW6-5]|uniref:hypothetical protein n=1 Tax=Maribacter sp. 2307ULW6-5 TaxID=3386275 RepID=UPI0039BC67F0
GALAVGRAPGMPRRPRRGRTIALDDLQFWQKWCKFKVLFKRGQGAKASMAGTCGDKGKNLHFFFAIPLWIKKVGLHLHPVSGHCPGACASSFEALFSFFLPPAGFFFQKVLRGRKTVVYLQPLRR